MAIKLMDSSLRDGGNVNDWKFGKRKIHGIVSDLVSAKVDYVELGYLRRCNFDENCTLYESIEQAEMNALPIIGSTEYSLMVQVDKWDWSNLTSCAGLIRNIRVSFHKIRVGEGMKLCRRVMENGYVCHCNPINIMGYSDIELLELIEEVNNLHPSVFTIVDTFGAMSLDDIRRINCILQNNLCGDIAIAVHLHENLGLAFALAIECIDYFAGKRDVIIDASLYGIGRVPGNLCIELIGVYLNQECGGGYELDYIYDAIDDYIVSIKKEHEWGYGLAYALSGFYNLHRSYAEFLLSKGKLKTKDIRAILSMIPLEERVIYNEKYIENLYRDYMCRDFDDCEYVSHFFDMLKKKEILIIAPGKSLFACKNRVANILTKDEVFSLSVNFIPDDVMLKPDCVFFTNGKRLAQQSLSHCETVKVAITSNLLSKYEEPNFVFNYSSLVNFNGNFSEDSVLMLLHLLNMHQENGKRVCHIVGFDNIDGKFGYVDESMEIGYSVLEDIGKVRRLMGEFSNLKINLISKEDERNENSSSGSYEIKQ